LSIVFAWEQDVEEYAAAGRRRGEVVEGGGEVGAGRAWPGREAADLDGFLDGGERILVSGRTTIQTDAKTFRLRAAF
jgi:hypothetical protein